MRIINNNEETKNMPATAPKTRGRPRKAKPEEIEAATKASMNMAQKRGRAQQSAEGVGGIGKQGASASGKAPAADTAGEIRGGTKQVLITEARIGGRGGRPAGVEDYPFGELTPARKEKDGTIVGPSFFIPMEDRAQGKLAAARKRHRDADGRPAIFLSRKTKERLNGDGPLVEGLRIWRGTREIAELV